MRIAIFVILIALLPSVEAQKLPTEKAKELAELQPKIDTAIDRGIDYLLSMQQRDGSFSDRLEGYHTGMTALAVYTLLKSGLPVEHSAVRRGLQFISQESPKETYSAGCVLMAYGATGKSEYVAKMEAIVKDLLKWQQGAWAYPASIKDLSNTQYGALGLRAAHRAGIKIPGTAWQDLVQAVLKFQEKEQHLDDKGAAGYSGVSRVGAGFRYRVGGEPVTGSMTAAGIGCLAIATECWERMPDAFMRQAKTSIDWGTNWIGANFSVKANPKNPGWYCYYMYGLERVGSLLKTEQIGSNYWYLEGAKELVAKQGGSGDWTDGGYEALPGTCFILLFLQRASAGSTGGHEPKKPNQFASEDPTHEVRLRGSGGADGTPLSMWVSGFATGVVRSYTSDDSPVKGLRVAKVEYLVNDQVVVTTTGNPDIGWSNESYAGQYQLPSRGKYKVRARVYVVDPASPKGSTSPTSILEAPGYEVDARQVHEDWMDIVAKQRSTMLWPKEGVRAQASSEQTDSGRTALKAIDGFDATAWSFLPKDKSPWITIVSAQAAKATHIRLTQMNGLAKHRDGHDVIRKVSIRINGSKTPIEVELDPDEIRPTWIELGEMKEIRKLEIAIVARNPGKSWPGFGGFSEIALENRPPEKKK